MEISRSGAANQTTTELTLTITATPAPDNDFITVAKPIVEGATFAAVTQANTTTQAHAKLAAQTVISGLALNGVNATIVDEIFIPAVAGTKENPNGTNGTYTFKVELTKGDGTKQTTSVITMSITATPYTNDGGNGGLGLGAIIGIVAGVIALLGVGGFAVWHFVIRKKKTA